MNKSMSYRSRIQHVFKVAARQFKHSVRRYQTWQAARLALAQRREILLYLGAVNFPTRLNAPAFMGLAGGKVQVLIRRSHLRTGKFQFSLSPRTRPGVDARLLICLNPATRLGYAVWMPIQDGQGYVALTLAQARQQAIKVFNY